MEAIPTLKVMLPLILNLMDKTMDLREDTPMGQAATIVMDLRRVMGEVMVKEAMAKVVMDKEGTTTDQLEDKDMGLQVMEEQVISMVQRGVSITMVKSHARIKLR
jgi:hypothetical protein